MQLFKRIMVCILVAVLAFNICAFTASATSDESFQYLSDIPWSSVIPFEGNNPAIDKSYYQGELSPGQVRPLNIFGTEYQKGLGMHSNITVTYDLGGTCTRLTAIVGPDNSCNTSANMGTMGLQIYLDSEMKFYKTMDIRDSSKVYNVDLDLTGVQELKFVGTPEGLTWSDSMCIADARIYGEFPTDGVGEFLSFDLQLPANSPLEGIGILDGSTIYITVPENLKKTELKAVFTTGTSTDTVTVNGVAQTSGVTTNDFSSPVTYTVNNEAGSRNYTVKVGTWRDIPGHYYDGDALQKPERPYIRDYTKTLTMKLFLASPNGNGGSNVRLTFDEALELIKEVDAVTCGIPKIIYLVGWQYKGHDDKYPSWAEVNENLRCKNCNHATAKECLQWLMDEAVQYNTSVSFHINSTDAYMDSPLWGTYATNNLISKSNGNYMAIGSYNGKTAYQINYKNEWESGYYKARVDQLLEDFPQIRRAGTIHSDAFFCRASDQSSLSEEEAARRKMYRYWRDCGVDLTSEFLYSSNGSSEYNYSGTGTGLIGLQPMTWHFNQSDSQYITRPASLATGGSINPGVGYGGEQKQMEILFGRSMWGETLLTQEGTTGPTPGWEQNFIDEFCTSTLPWAFLNQFERKSLTGSGNTRTVTYSNGVVTSLVDNSITQNDRLIRSGDDVFVPVVWKEKQIIAYSKTGYSNRTWSLPDDWSSVKSVDLFAVSKKGLTCIGKNIECSEGQIELSLNGGQMVVIAPTDAITVTSPYGFDLLSPENGQLNVDTNTAKLTWESSRNAISYQVTVAESANLTNKPQTKTVSDTEVDLAEFTLSTDKVYYWQVTAVAATGETTVSNGEARSFVTTLTGELDQPSNLKVMRYRDDFVKISWDTTGIPYQYQVLRRATGDSEFSIIGTTSEGTFTDTTASRVANQTYEYKVRISDGTGCYRDSAIVLLDHEIYLSDLECSVTNPAAPGNYWGELVRDGNLNQDHAAIRIGGITYGKGLEFHANSDYSWNISGAYSSFRAIIGIDDVNVEQHKPTNVILSVYGDGQLLYESGVFTINTAPVELDLDITGIQTLKLAVRNSNGNNDSAWSAWGSARLTPASSDDQVALINAKDIIESSSYTVAQEVANTTEAVKDWLVDQINTSIVGTGITVVTNDVTLTSFEPATAGNPENAAGTNGGFNFTVSLRKGSSTSSASTSGTILALIFEMPVESTYTVTFDSNGGSSIESQTIEAGGFATNPGAPIRSGYIFDGWFSDAVCTQRYNFMTPVNSDLMLYAGWREKYIPPVTPGKPGDSSKPTEPERVEIPFRDVDEGDWYYEAVKYVYDNGLMNGVDGNKFAPNDSVSRAMVWTVLARMEDVNTNVGDTWYARSQIWAKHEGVSDGTNPMENVTREQLAAMLYRYAGSPAVSGNLSAYPDGSKVSDWAEDAMIWATSVGLINGMNGKLNPQGSASRAQLATMLMRFEKIVKA